MKKIKLVIIGIISVTLSSCVPAILVGGGAVGKTAAQERSVGNAVDDAATWTRIKNAIFVDKEATKMFVKVGVKVLEGRVLLTGFVPSYEDKLKLLRLVWEQKGVKEVISEITIDGNQERSLKAIALDSWITAQIKSNLLVNEEIRSVNYNVETIDKVVYLLGIANSESELDLVTNIAGTTKNVTRVVSYVRIKDSNLRKQMLNKYN